jgi:hypothetical protein
MRKRVGFNNGRGFLALERFKARALRRELRKQISENPRGIAAMRADAPHGGDYLPGG